MADRDEMVKRQRALADFGDFALRSQDLQEVLTEACRLVTSALGVDLAKIVEIEAGQANTLVRAGVNWKPGIIGQMRIPLDERSPDAFAIGTGEPVTTLDIAQEDRFDIPAFLREHGVNAFANVPIYLPGREIYGLLEVDSCEPRAFDKEDIEFLRTYSVILGPVIDRLHKIRHIEQSDERFRLIVENARDYAIFMTDADGVISDWLPGAAAVFGWRADEVIGQSGDILFTPEDRAARAPQEELETARKGGVASDVRWHVRQDGRRVFLDGQSVALRHPDGRIRGFLKIGQDVTERRQHEEYQAVLLAELQHRVRNVLAVVRALINRGGDGATVEQFRAELEGRIEAMARTQALLTRGAGAGVDLKTLILDELLIHIDDPGRVTTTGTAVKLAPKAAEVLTLAVHELATNALKYGALKQAAGSIAVHWTVEEGQPLPILHLVWQESGAAITSPTPRRVGFGTELITRRVPYELKGKGQIAIEPDGLRCTIDFPLATGESIFQTDGPSAGGGATL